MSGLDPDFVRPFLIGTCQTLKVQCNFDVTAGRPFHKGKGEGEEFRCDIAGIIGITSKVFQGSIAICFPENTFLKLMSSMLGEEFEKIDQDLEDGASELMNIVFGQAKKELNEKGYGLEMALPSVIRGENLLLGDPHAPVIIVPFSSNEFKFQIQIAIKKGG